MVKLKVNQVMIGYITEICEEIDAENFKKYETIGVMAGASTPMEIIEKVIEKLEELC